METKTNDTSPHHTFGRVREIPGDVEKTRTVPFELSNGNVDRHRTRMNMDNWVLEHYNENPIVGYQRDVYGGGMCNKANPDDVIGTGKAYMRDGRLLSDITFESESVNPQAEKIFKKVTVSKSLRAVSVGISPIGGGTLIDNETGEEKQLDSPPWQIPKGYTFDYEGQELLEQSIVNIPSNRQALKRSLRSQTANALQYIKRVLGTGYSFGDIEKMTVGNVLRMLDGEEPLDHEENETQLRDLDTSNTFTFSNTTESEDKEIEEDADRQGNLQKYRRKLTLINL